MEIAIVLLVVIAVPIGLLLWTRRNRNPGDPGTDAYANRNLGQDGGPPRHSQQGWPDSGGAGS